jgi:hypothetical protein
MSVASVLHDEFTGHLDVAHYLRVLTFLACAHISCVCSHYFRVRIVGDEPLV